MNFVVGYMYDKKCSVYVAKVLNLPGCMSQGKTLKEMKKNIKDAIDACLEVRKKEMRKFSDAVIVSTILKRRAGEFSPDYH